MPKETSHTHKRPFLTPGMILIVLMVFAIAVRVAIASTRLMIQLDETAYVRIAENLIAGRGYFDITGMEGSQYFPLFPLVIAALAIVLNDYVLAGYVTVIAFGTLIMIPTYLLGKELVGERVGLMAAGLVAVMPLLVDYSSRLYSENVYVFFLMMAVYYGWMLLKNNSIAWGVLTGLSLGIAYLANPSTLIYVVAFATLLVAVGFKKHTLFRMAGLAAILVMCFALFGVPFSFFVHNVSGKWTYSSKSGAGNIYNTNHGLEYGTLAWEKDVFSLTPDGKTIHLAKINEEAKGPLGTIIESPGQSAQNFVKMSKKFFSKSFAVVMPPWLLPLLALGVFNMARDRNRFLKAAYLLLMISPALIILIMDYRSRFFYPFLPLLMIWVAEGWSGIEKWMKGLFSPPTDETRMMALPKLVPWLMTAVIIGPLLLLTFGINMTRSYDTESREAGEWLKQQYGVGKRVANRQYTVAYYAGDDSVAIPYADLESTTIYLREKDADFLVIGRQEILDWRPQYASLLDGQADHLGWNLINILYPDSSREILIFELS